MHHLQSAKDGRRVHDLVTASITVKGMERVNRRSDRAKLKMKMFLAVLISFLQIHAAITLTFPGTKSF